MNSNFIIFFFYYFIILISIFGYGFILLKFDNKQAHLNFGHLGLCGVFVLIIYSYLSNIFIPHTQLHNTIIILVGLINFYFNLKNIFNRQIKKNVILLFLIFIILFISLLIFKNHDDFPYYHFSYTYHLTQDSLNFGLGKFNHGFRTPSSIFYLNSLFYLPFAEYYLFNFSSVYVLGFANMILLNKIFSNNQILNKYDFLNTNFIRFLSLLTFVFINVFFYRISEYGTDRAAQILIMILFISLFEIFQKKSYDKKNFLFIYILLSIIISLKSFYFLYVLFSIPFILFVINKEKNIRSSLKIIFFNKYFFYFTLSVFIILFSNFNNTGCLLYPVWFTCYENIPWSIPVNSVIEMNNWYELWSKAGANPNGRVSNPEIYILGLNWVSNWIDSYFFNKVSDFLFGLILVIVVFFIFFCRGDKEKNINLISKYTIITYSIILIIFLEWFFNHPALRYGGYCIIALILFIPSAFYLSKFQISYKKFKKLSLIIVVISYSIFELRNYGRILNEINLYGYKPLNQTFYHIDEKYFEIEKRIKSLKNSKGVFSKSIF